VPHRAPGRMIRAEHAGDLGAGTRRRFYRGIGFETIPDISNRIFPTQSQLHGPLLHVARADHPDLVGH